ncbi:uncharacterized protein HMPREF1541_04523 [Cyphellophora europaea CBS 101466]|uniref:37S ribosomal protein S25, mitochondrial n=1 Tax=Cyphellophora europaea (strain CBS 101466) TaxID=1220924 RepID=W2RUX7_CYPE1|nr:uncharacterized protein HMPREF1541_04523 [Cyphellophora europaea CBS 101466]ETN40247.1 hypothetical protein HMPREF1541_04523 [Cyphellophora europaea CBS 101466]
MGRINLTALRVRSRALRRKEATDSRITPIWANIVADVPPAQIMTRHQPIEHHYTETRTKTLPDGRSSQATQIIAHAKPKTAKPKQLYSPTPLRYEEDTLRKQFFSDHPWELARPRTLVETDGKQYARANWSTGIKQRGLPVSGESVVQRQLWLLHNVPDITVPEAYDIARKEFYAVRRRQQTAMRIAVEEAEMFGADFGVPAMSVGMSKEDKVYTEWVGWAAEEAMRITQQRAGFEGSQVSTEQKAIEGNAAGLGGARFGGQRTGMAQRQMAGPSSQVGSSLA